MQHKQQIGKMSFVYILCVVLCVSNISNLYSQEIPPQSDATKAESKQEKQFINTEEKKTKQKKGEVKKETLPMQPTSKVKQEKSIPVKKTIIKTKLSNNRPLSKTESLSGKRKEKTQSKTVIVAVHDVIEQIPDFHYSLIPGYVVPSFKIKGDSPASEDTQSQPKAGSEVVQESKDSGISFFDSISKWFSEFTISQGFINALLLIVTVVVFTMYRIRGGPRRRI